MLLLLAASVCWLIRSWVFSYSFVVDFVRRNLPFGRSSSIQRISGSFRGCILSLQLSVMASSSSAGPRSSSRLLLGYPGGVSSFTPPGEENKGVGDPRAAVFVTTSLSTRMALDVHLHDTVADMKRNIVLEHSTLFPGYKEIKIDAVKLNRRGMSYSLSDSMLLLTILNGMKGNMFLCVDASVCGEEHLEEQGLMNHAGGLNIEEDNEEAAVIGASSLGTKETDHKETSIKELPLIVPELAVVDVTGQVNGVQQNGCPEHGDNNREFIRDEAIPKAVGVVVCEPSAAASVVADKSSAKKRKKPPPKRESSRKQEPKEKKHVLDQVVGSKVASTPAEPKIPNKTADLEMRPLKGDPKEMFELKHIVVIGLKGDSCLAKSKEAVDGDRTEVHSQEAETHGAADILGEKGDVAGTNKNAEPILKTVGSSKDKIVSAFSKEMEMETVRSGKEIMKSSSRKEGRKEMTKKRRLTSDRHSVAILNSSKPSAKRGELSEPDTFEQESCCY